MQLSCLTLYLLARGLQEGANLDMFKIFGWFVQEMKERCLQQDPQL